MQKTPIKITHFSLEDRRIVCTVYGLDTEATVLISKDDFTEWIDTPLNYDMTPDKFWNVAVEINNTAALKELNAYFGHEHNYYHAIAALNRNIISDLIKDLPADTFSKAITALADFGMAEYSYGANTVKNIYDTIKQAA